MTTIKHTVNGKEYEIRSMQTNERWEARTFHRGEPVSPTYAISFDTGLALAHYNGQRAVEVLTTWAKSDLDAGFVK
jgi:hypothetical protein